MDGSCIEPAFDAVRRGRWRWMDHVTYSHTLASNDVTVNDNIENEYDMKNIAGLKQQRINIIVHTD